MRYILLFLFFFTQNTFSQTLQQVYHQGSASNVVTNSVRTSSNGSIIVCGSTMDSLAIGGNNLFHTGGFISSYDSSGLNNWLIPAGGLTTYGYYRLPALEIDNNNDIIVIGEFNDSCLVGNTMLTEIGLGNTFLAKIDMNGSVLWLKKLTDNSATFMDLAIDSNNSIILTGTLNGSLIIGVDTLIPQYSDVIIMKLDNNGDFIWMKNAGGSGSYGETGFSIDTDINDNIYLTGVLRSIDPTFDSIVIPNQNTSGYLGFISKYSSSGNALWAKRCGYESKCISTDSNGTSYIGGYAYQIIVFDTIVLPPTGTGLVKAFVIAVDIDGNFIWGQTISSDNSNTTAITSDNFGNCIAAGITRDTTRVIGTTDTLELVNDVYLQNNNYGFIVSFDSIGNPNWGNTILNSNYGISLNDINVHNCYISFCGNFSSSTFPIYYNNDSLISQGGNDGFTIVHDYCNGLNSLNQSYTNDLNISYYPNPVSDLLYFQTNYSGQLHLKLIDQIGKVVLNRTILGGISPMIIDMDGVANGFYFLSIYDDQNILNTVKISVLRK